MFHTNCFTFAGFAHQQSSVAVCASHSMVCVCVCVPNTRSRFVIVQPIVSVSCLYLIPVSHCWVLMCVMMRAPPYKEMCHFYLNCNMLELTWEMLAFKVSGKLSDRKLIDLSDRKDRALDRNTTKLSHRLDFLPESLVRQDSGFCPGLVLARLGFESCVIVFFFSLSVSNFILL